MNTLANVAVIGGGISGLAAAYELSRHLPTANITLFDQAKRFGGILRTESIDRCLIETSADMFLSKPDDAVKLCGELGLADQLIEPEMNDRRSWIGFGKKLHQIPEGFSIISPSRLDSILKTDLLSSYGKLRMLSEIAIPASRFDEDISLRDFAVSRFGSEAFDRLIQPLVAGIYTADPAKLSIQATMPQVIAKLKKYGSLIRAAQHDNDGQQKQASGARYGMFRSLQNGLSQLIDALVNRLKNINMLSKTAVRKIKPDAQRWRIETDAGENETCFKSVIVALPTHQSARIVGGFDKQLADQLSAIEYASAAIIVVGAPRDHFQNPLAGFGMVIPSVEKRPVIALSCANRKFAGRSAPGLELYRVFIGGALQPELVDLDDHALTNIAIEELRHWLGFNGNHHFAKNFRWHNAMPQYHVGHVQRVNSIKERVAKHPGLFVTCNAFEGVGIPACIAAARRIASDAVQHLSSQSGQN